MQFEVEFRIGTAFPRIIDAVRQHFDPDLTLRCSEHGVSFQQMDSSHVSMIDVQLQPNAFERYYCQREMDIGIELKMLCKILNTAKPDDVIVIRVTNRDTDQLTIQIQKPDNILSTVFTIRFYDFDHQLLGITTLNYQATLSLPSRELQRILAEMSLIGSFVEINAGESRVHFTTQSAESDVSVTCTNCTHFVDETKNVRIDVREPARAMFSLSHCSVTTQVLFHSTVTLKICAEQPLSVEYDLVETVHQELPIILRNVLLPIIPDEVFTCVLLSYLAVPVNVGHVQFHVAPKIPS